MRQDTTPQMIADSILSATLDQNAGLGKVVTHLQPVTVDAEFAVTLANGKTYRVRVTEEA